MSLIAPPLRSSLVGLLAMLFVAGLADTIAAQSPVATGQEAQALQEAPAQTDSQPRHKARVRRMPAKPAPMEMASLVTPDQISAETTAMDRMIARHIAPQQPNRPIPVVLILLGSMMIVLWGGLLVGAVLTTATLSLILLIAMLVFIPILILGIVFLIGGIAASSSKSRKAKATPGKGS